jgi:glutamate--cysteine ligase
MPNATTMRFIDVFLLHCLLSPSAPDTPEEIGALGRNQHRAAAFGREPGLRLERATSATAAGGAMREVTLLEWAEEILDACLPIAAALDAAAGAGHAGHVYREALAAARQALAAPDSLPSARVLATVQRDFAGSYTGFVRAMAEQTRARHMALPWTREQQSRHEAAALESLMKRQAIEAADNVDFETWRQAYLDPARARFISSQALRRTQGGESRLPGRRRYKRWCACTGRPGASASVNLNACRAVTSRPDSVLRLSEAAALCSTNAAVCCVV